MAPSTKHDQKLDNDKELRKKSEFYDTADVATEFDTYKSKTEKATSKRIQLLVTTRLYQDAVDLGEHTGTGHENVMRIALVIGMKEMKRSICG